MTGPKETEPDAVVLHMDDLSRGNGLHPRASITEADGAAARLPGRLLETDNTNNPRPESGPEIDDLEEGTSVRGLPQPGVDDGLLDLEDDENVDIGSRSPRPSIAPTPDVNLYQQKKTIAQGMMDLALISANANQFRYVLQSSTRQPYYKVCLSMIGLSLFLQVVVGIGLIWNSRYNVKHDDQMCKANQANNWTVIAIFLVTVLNVFITSFGVVDPNTEIIYANRRE